MLFTRLEGHEEPFTVVVKHDPAVFGKCGTGWYRVGGNAGFAEEVLRFVRPRTEPRAGTHKCAAFGVAGKRTPGGHTNVRAARGNVRVRRAAANADLIGTRAIIKAVRRARRRVQQSRPACETKAS